MEEISHDARPLTRFYAVIGGSRPGLPTTGYVRANEILLSGVVCAGNVLRAMREIVKDLIQTHIVGDDTPERIVAAQACPALREAKIGLTGLSDAGRDYLMIRVRPGFEHLLVCLGGEGQVLVDDRWRPCGAGLAYLAPAVATHAFRTVGRRRWRFCWVMYEGPKPGDLPVIGGDRPRLVDADPRGLWSSIEGLYQEAVGSAEPLMLDRWAALVQSQAARVVDPHHERDPLWQLWAAVTADLAAAWSLDRLAGRALTWRRTPPPAVRPAHGSNADGTRGPVAHGTGDRPVGVDPHEGRRRRPGGGLQ